MLVMMVSIFIIIRVNHTQVTNNNASNPITNTGNNLLSDEEKKNLMKTIGNALENETNKEVLSVNGEKITEREIALCDFQLNHSIVNEEEKKDTVDEIIKDYVISQDADKLGISLTAKEMQDIKDVVKFDEDTADLLKELNMSYNEFCEMYINRRTKLDLKLKWATHIMELINNGDINISSELFNNKYKEYLESEDFSIKTQLLKELLDIYAEYLVSQAIVEKVG